MKSKLHALAGAIALITISTFWISSVLSEFLGTHADIAFVKWSVLKGMAVLIPALVLAGSSGAVLSKNRKWPVIQRKQRRMKIAAINGMTVLVPSAVFLAFRADGGLFDGWFYSVQALELAAGAVNIWLLGANMRDGLALSRRKTA